MIGIFYTWRALSEVKLLCFIGGNELVQNRMSQESVLVFESCQWDLAKFTLVKHRIKLNHALAACVSRWERLDQFSGSLVLNIKHHTLRVCNPRPGNWSSLQTAYFLLMTLNTLSRLKVGSINAHQVHVILVASMWTMSDKSLSWFLKISVNLDLRLTVQFRRNLHWTLLCYHVRHSFAMLTLTIATTAIQ